MKITIKTPLLVLAAATAMVASSSGQSIIAYDNANTGGYAPQPDHGWPAYNGGSGYGLWTPLADTSGGGAYMEGVGVNGRQVDGSYSFALYAGGGAYDISRPLTTSITTGDFSIITRFDVAGAGLNMVDLRTGNNTSGFSVGQLLSFGLDNGNQLTVIDASGVQLLPSGEARGDAWDWNVDFDAGAGTYTLSVTNLGGGFADLISGSLEASSTSVGSFAVINSSTGNNQNVIFDAPEFVVPEPSTMVLGAGGMATWLLLRRRR